MDPTLAEVTAVLGRTPAILNAWLDDLSAAWLDASEGEGTFSPRDVLGHLIHGELTDWMPRIRMILESGDTRPFEPFDRHGFKDMAGASVGELLTKFGTLRAANLAALESLHLTPEQMALKGMHPALGPVTLGQLLATWTVHGLNHLSQIARVMSHRYVGAVGPWKEYLGVLKK